MYGLVNQNYLYEKENVKVREKYRRERDRYYHIVILREQLYIQPLN